MRKAIAILLLFVALDWAISLTLGLLNRRTTRGEAMGLLNFALDQDPQILILGSSRAKHHIMPSVLSAETSRSAFNAGINGQDFLYAYMLFELWRQRHEPPQAIILNVDPESFAISPDEIARTSIFSTYYDKDREVREILLMRGPFERLKYFCRSYRFNGKVLPILKNVGKPQAPGFDGFEPLTGAADAATAAQAANPPPPIQSPWVVKIHYFNELADFCQRNGTRLLLVHSPYLRADIHALSTWSGDMRALASSHPGVVFIEISERTYPSIFSNNPSLFRDANHLNGEGARIFSILLGKEIKRFLPSRP